MAKLIIKHEDEILHELEVSTVKEAKTLVNIYHKNEIEQTYIFSTVNTATKIENTITLRK